MKKLDQLPQKIDLHLHPLVNWLVKTFPNLHPNWYTVIRIILIGPMVALMLHQRWILAFSLFLLGAFLDLLDGPVARLANKTSRTGAFLDPLADKLLFISAITVFYPLLVAWLFWTICLIEVFLLIEHTYKFFYFYQADAITRRDKQKSNVWGKVKFALEIIAIIVLFLGHDSQALIIFASMILVLATGLAFQSLFVHLKSYSSK
jgi:CDP-diacylglycerol--glycerol-3-phosphate 3-phosphatidyltransferase